MSRTRTFVAVDPGAEVRAAAVALQKTLGKADAAAGVKWADAGGMHLTLVFLGEVDDKDLHAVCRAVGKAVRGEAPFPVRVAGVGAFPTARRPKVIWGGVTDGADRLQRLHERIAAAVADVGGFRREERAYTPHLTLGRVNSEADGFALAPELAKVRAWDGGRAVIDEVLVMASELTRDGPEYTVLGRAELEGKT